MGFRFRKGVRILPGLRLNVTKNGISSLTVGGRGLSYNIGKKGTRGTVGKPGTGLSYSSYRSYNGKQTPERIDPETGEIRMAVRKPGIPWVLVAILTLVVLGVYFLRAST